ncbi:MAG: sigma-54-dependent Fis family transcriptional regulator [Candidatus Eisenbacteria bacterium]|nr:sigma-54-dependent Fis family transcriptional regulator [Candidatus Eisenbacteria bacterium]
MPDESKTKGRLLLVDDDEEFLDDAIVVLSKDFECTGVADPERVLKACEVRDPDAVLLDLDFDGEPLGFEILTRIKEENPCLPVIMWTETEDVRARLAAQELGAFYYIHKAARPGDVAVVIDAALRKARALMANRVLRAELDRAWGDIIYASDAMREVVDMAQRVAEQDDTVLITGETGVGKGLLAHEIHKRSARASHEFMVVECAGITEHLADNELFGHEKGAFTDAYRREPGVCEAANRGTLFLDEVGDMPLTIQAKIRRVVEDKKIRRVGATSDRTVDIRIIAATNRELEGDVADGRFRQDLFYRLNRVRIHIPPLRTRRADILELAHHFLAKHAMPDGTRFRLSPESTVYLEGQDWPGNIRQLRNAVGRACALARGDVLTPRDFSGDLEEMRALMDWDESFGEFERSTFLRALQIGGSIRKAAELMGVTKDKIFGVIRRRGIAVEEWKKDK